MKSPRFLSALALVFALPAFASHPVDKRPTNYQNLKKKTANFAHAQSGRASIGKPLPRFAVKNLRGGGFTNASFKGKMALFVLADTQCPCVQAVESRVKSLASRYKNDLRVAYVFSMPKEKPIEIARFMHRRDLPFSALIDSNQRFLKQLDGRASSEVFLVDKNGVLRYHGRVDDSTFDPRAVKSRDLENAIRAVKANKKVARPEVPAMGCAIPRI